MICIGIFIFEIILLIGILIICVDALDGLWKNGCWIFDNDWWINKRELNKLEERISKLEKIIENNLK